MRRKLRHLGEKPTGTLARLEDRHGIDREPLKRALDHAIQRQRKLDRFVKAQANQAQSWKEHKRRLEQRRHNYRKAAARQIAELEESLLDEIMKPFLVDRFVYVADIIDLGLRGRSAAAGFLQRVAQLATGRSRGRPTKPIVDECLKSLVSQLRDQLQCRSRNQLSLEYLSALAQVSGEMKENLKDPAAALDRRIKRHRPSQQTEESLAEFRHVLGTLSTGWPSPSTTIDEALVVAREITLGRWPEAVRIGLPESGKRPRVRRRRVRPVELERFYDAELSLMTVLRTSTNTR